MPETFHITFFKDQWAKTFTSADLTLEELRDRIQKSTAPTKTKLPWLKMATFGKKIADPESKCLRHDGNVLNITGIELDYDAMKITFSEALSCLRDMKVKALIYTSPSHQDAKPKWRILAPVSVPLAGTQRAKYVARLNGALGCPIKKPESFTLSQSYYFGQADDNQTPNHQVFICEGEFIDQRDDLAKFEKDGYAGLQQRSDTKTDNAETNPFTEAAQSGRHFDEAESHGFESILQQIGDGEFEGLKGFNNALSRAVASYVALHNGNEFDKQLLKEILRKAIREAPVDPGRSQKDLERYSSDKYLDNLIKTSTKKFVERMAMRLEDFVAYLPSHTYIYVPTGEQWPASSVNVLPAIPKLDIKGKPVISKKTNTQRTTKASVWLDKNNNVQQMTWMPGEPVIIENKLANAGGWVERKGARCFNMYKGPTLKLGDSTKALPWRQHVALIYPNEAEEIIIWLAHRVQRPGEKINHCIMLGGDQGIGKDTILEPVKRTIGAWNFHEITPQNLLGRFNGFTRSVILRINEGRDLGELDRYKFYEHLKIYTAAPPDVLRVDEKHLREHYVFNCMGVIITTNHKTDGLYLPTNDRRTFVAWSEKLKTDFKDEYFDDIYTYYNSGGDMDVAAYLTNLDISKFNPKAPPRLTDSWHAIVNSGYSPEQSGLADILDQLGNPPAVTIEQITHAADVDFAEWIQKSRRQVPHKLEVAGYTAIRNPYAADGFYKISGRRYVIYGRVEMTLADRAKAAKDLVANYNPAPDTTESNVHPFPGPKVK